MKIFDLGQQPITLEEVLQMAAQEAVLIRDRDGNEYILEPADAFKREMAQLGQNEEFMSFLAERARGSVQISFEEIEDRLKEAE